MILQMLLRGVAVASLAALPFAAIAQSDDGGSVAADTPIGDPIEGTGETYAAATFQDWEVRCLRTEPGTPEPCTLYQLIDDGAGNPVVEVNVFPLDDNGPAVAGASIITPLDTLLTPGLRVRVDEGEWSEYPFAFCRPIGCFARLGFTAENLDAFRAGDVALIGIVPLQAPDQLVALEMSLSGFTAAFEDLEARISAGDATTE